MRFCQLSNINYGTQDADHLKNVLKALDIMCDCHDSPHFQFLHSQLQLLICAPKARRFDKQTMILAAEVHNISPAAYKMLRRAGSIFLPSIKTIKNLLSCSFQDTNLPKLLKQLKPQQQLVNILFDEVKLTKAMRFSGGHVVGHAMNDS